MAKFRKGSQLGYIGLGKMGGNMVARLVEEGYKVTAYDRDEEACRRAEQAGAGIVGSVPELLESLKPPRVIWLMVPHAVVDDVLTEFDGVIETGDTVIDGGNSPYHKSIDRARMFADGGVKYLDVGVSGGPIGAREGACLMIGGPREEFERLEPLFKRLAVKDGYGYMGESGTGHFVKMVHNGIEYGMMQAVAEGFDIMRHSGFDLDLEKVAKVYAHGSVIESRLISLTEEAYHQWDDSLDGVSGRAQTSGEADWTVETARRLEVPTRVIGEALRARYTSQDIPNYQGQVITALRNRFGGHSIQE